MKESFGYVRVSTVKQGEGVSLEAQRDAISAFAERNGITITRWFEEKLTAAKSGRPMFGAMLKALKAGKAAGVVMHKIDRSARNFADWAKIGDLADAGIDVHFATESLDFRSRGGRLAADIQAVIAADYVRNLREETIKGITGRLKQGIYPFAAPIGYLNNGGGKPKTLDPIRAPLVRQAFEFYAGGGYSLRTLLAELTRRGLRNSRGKPLSKTGLERLLASPFYIGLIRIRRTGTVYAGIHAPLITTDIFERVQEVRAGKAGKKVTRHNHIYRGLFRCALCAGPMIPERQKGHVYYRCQTPACPTKCIREEALELAVGTALGRARLTDGDAERLAAEIIRWCASRARRDGSTAATLQLAQIDGRLDRLTDAYVDRVVDAGTYTRRKQALLQDRRRLEEEVAAKRDRSSDPDHVRRFLELVGSLVSTHEIVRPWEKRRMAEIFTSNRTIARKYVSTEPQKWLMTPSEVVTVLYGAHDRPTSRTRATAKVGRAIGREEARRAEHLDRLIEVARSREVVEAIRVFKSDRAAGGHHGESGRFGPYHP